MKAMAQRKPNVLDAIIILLVLGIVAISMVLFMGKEEKEVNLTTIEFDILATDLYPEHADSMKDRIGTPITFGKSNKDMGVLKEVKIFPYEMLGMDTISGIHKWEYHPLKKEVILTVEAQVVETQDAFLSGDEQIAVGVNMPFLGKGFGFANAYVLGIREVSE